MSAHRIMSWLLAVCAISLAVACGGGGSTVLTPPAASTADVSVLMLGNSHTHSHDLSGRLAAMLRAGLPGRTVLSAVAPDSLFLDEHLANGTTMALLRGQHWSVVVLQAQKYSQSGCCLYSTGEAEALVGEARAVGALPLMFPEWPRRGVRETARIYALHAGIAQAEPACVAPIGQAWDLALARHPSLALHASDGNHASATGAFLTALVLYATITSQSPLALPDIDGPVAPATQAQLRQVAADAVLAVSPRLYCPLDPPVR